MQLPDVDVLFVTSCLQALEVACCRLSTMQRAETQSASCRLALGRDNFQRSQASRAASWRHARRASRALRGSDTQRRRCTHSHASAKVVSVAATPASQWLVSIGIFIVCCCAGIFFIAWTFLAWVRFLSCLLCSLNSESISYTPVPSAVLARVISCPSTACSTASAPAAQSRHSRHVDRCSSFPGLCVCPMRTTRPDSRNSALPVPRLQRLRRTARHVEHALDTISEHVPTLSSSVNLTSLELADCILEFNHLSQEVTGGIKASANTLRASQEQLVTGGQALKKVLTDVVMPGFKERAKATGGARPGGHLSARASAVGKQRPCMPRTSAIKVRAPVHVMPHANDSTGASKLQVEAPQCFRVAPLHSCTLTVRAHAEIVDHVLHSNAKLQYDEPTTAQLAAATKTSIRELRQALAASAALSQIVSAGASAFSSYAARQQHRARQHAQPGAMPAAEAAGAWDSVDGAGADVGMHRAQHAPDARQVWDKLQHKQLRRAQQRGARPRPQASRATEQDAGLQASIRSAWGFNGDAR